MTALRNNLTSQELSKELDRAVDFDIAVATRNKKGRYDLLACEKVSNGTMEKLYNQKFNEEHIRKGLEMAKKTSKKAAKKTIKKAKRVKKVVDVESMDTKQLVKVAGEGEDGAAEAIEELKGRIDYAVLVAKAVSKNKPAKMSKTDIRRACEEGGRKYDQVVRSCKAYDAVDALWSE